MEEQNQNLQNAASELTIEQATEREDALQDQAVQTSGELVQLSDEDVEQKVYYKELTPARMVMRRFFRSRLSVVGLVMIIILFAFSFLGPPICKMFGYTWSETEQDETPVDVMTGSWITGTVNGETVEAYEYKITRVPSNSKAPPSANHLLGTDDSGRDIFIRLMYGGRISLTIGFVVVILETLLGVILGGISGYFGKWVDQIIMRIVDILNCIPTLPLLLIASFVLDSWKFVEPEQKIYYLMGIMTIFGWSGTARLVRGQILYLREQEYIVACEVMGIPTWRRIFVHLIPNIMPQLIVSMTLGLGGVILYEATLSYLGLGIPYPQAAWGTMINAGTETTTIMSNYPNWWLPAGLLIVIAVLGFNFVGDGLRDAMDPKAKK